MGNSGLKQHYETAKKTGVLKISQKKLTEFPTDLKQLEPLLRTLDLSENRFTTLPNEIGSFILLKHLNVNQNRLTSLPETVGHLSKLESLSVCSNKLTSLPHTLSNLSNLKQVYASDNQITKFPLMLCGLRHLDVLDLSRNKIAEVPTGVSDIHVTELILNQNQVSNLSEDIADCPRLKTLRLEENCLQLDAICPRILTDSKISILALDGNLFDMKSFAEAEGYDKYMERYTAVKKKMF
jgi:Leucine-rich repeat (LRR) protein